MKDQFTYAHDKDCDGCRYQSFLGYCQYTIITGHCRSRICPPGKGCTARVEGKRLRAPLYTIMDNSFYADCNQDYSYSKFRAAEVIA
jgi:hypothetical protein